MNKEILGFYCKLKNVSNFWGMPSGWKLANPYTGHWERFEFFVKKYYSSRNKRNLIVALNPGRFGCNQTGIALTDENILKNKLGYPGEIKSSNKEKTATRIYSVIEEVFPDLNKFFDRYFMTNIFPFGVLDEKGNNVVFNDLIKIKSIEEFSFGFIKDSIDLFGPERVLCVGRGSERFMLNNFPKLDVKYLHHPARIFPEEKKKLYRENIL